ncbi:MAG: ABC transporter permease [Planctomycetes bacterium]|nr:ABC transporter permease [Planctomycetota bacterium]
MKRHATRGEQAETSRPAPTSSPHQSVKAQVADETLSTHLPETQPNQVRRLDRPLTGESPTALPVHSTKSSPRPRAFVRAAEALGQFLNSAWTILIWELRSFLLRPASYGLLLAAALVAAWGFSWLVTLLSPGAALVLRQADDPLAQFLGPNVFLIGECTLLVPLLTMNSIAEERRRGTWEQLLTARTSPLAVVVGKFAAIWLELMLALSPWVYDLVVLRFWSGRMTDWHGIPWFESPGLDFDVGILWGGCAGLAVVGATFVAVGVLCSSLCRSPVSAAILAAGSMGWILLLALAPRVLASWNFSVEQIAIVESLSCWAHLERFSRGTLEPQLMAGHVSACAVFLAGTAALCRRNQVA